MKRKFKIGDFVNYEGRKCEVLAYSGIDYTININDYTININDEHGHDGRSYSFDEQGNEIDPHCDTCWYVSEKYLIKWED